MIEIQKAKQELIKHVKEQKIDNPKVENKLAHVLRVAKNSKELANNLKVPEEHVTLAELIGLLHDIGRFEQYKPTNEAKKFNHGEAGVELLKKDNYLRRFTKEEKYDDIILTAIYEHNRYELSKGLTKEQELFSKIIKDSDKIDLIYEGAEIYWKSPEVIKSIEEGKLEPKMLQEFYQEKLPDNRNAKSKIDEVLSFISFVFDLNFSYSLQKIKQSNNINKMIDRFCYQIPETKEEMKKVKKVVNEYLERKQR